VSTGIKNDFSLEVQQGSTYNFYIRYVLVKDVAGSILEVNFTPNYLEDVLALRDTWYANFSFYYTKENLIKMLKHLFIIGLRL